MSLVKLAAASLPGIALLFPAKRAVPESEFNDDGEADT
jgi:hypothetical protein